MKNKILLASILAVLSQQGYANDTAAELELLKQQVKLLTEKIEQLEAKTTENTPPKPEAPEVVKVEKKESKSSWADRVKFSADIRDRYEYIDQKGREIRQRNRIRLRANMNMQVNDNLDFTLGMASGGDDPVSTNQSLDGGFSTKDLRLDLAYFNYKFSDSLKLSGGKMKNPFYIPGKNPILWDSDLNPEGFALNYTEGLVNATLVGMAVEERSSADDTLMFGGQLVFTHDLSDSVDFNAGVGYYDYQNIKGETPLYDGNAKGNTLNANGRLANDFNTAELFAELKTKISGLPFSVYGNYYKNTAADDLDTAYTLGFKLGKVSDAGSWDMGLAYLDTEADALIGTFNDSDFAGGNTDSRGYLLKAGYGLMKNVSLGLTYIDSEIGQSKPTQTDYDRLQLDFIAKFK